MKTVLKWIIKSMFVLLLFFIMGYVAYSFYISLALDRVDQIMRADVFAKEFITSELNRDFGLCREMIYDDGSDSLSETFSQTWDELQEKLDEVLRNNNIEIEYSSIGIVGGFPAVWFEFGDKNELLQVAVINHKGDLKIISQSYNNFVINYYKTE